MMKMPQVMGIINLTPDSFYDHYPVEQAVERALGMIEAGADIIDIGGQSTRPGATVLSEEEEWSRVEPFLKQARGKLAAKCSIDTFYPSVARKALAMGVDIINDVTGLDNAEMIRVAAQSGAPVIVMHHEGGNWQQVYDWLLARSRAVMERGVAEQQIIWDPGIGFGKHYQEDCALLKHTGDLCAGGFPVLVGASNKRVVGAACGAPLAERITGSVTAHVLAARQGAQILRVHNVKETVMGLRMALAIESEGEYGQNTY